MTPSPPPDASAYGEDGRKRVAKACDRCRLKKIKCDGKHLCSRCKTENAICRYGDRKKSIERRVPPGYVEYLEEQQKVLVSALKQTWRASVDPQNPLAASKDPSVHSILEDLGVLSNLQHRSPFEEDLEKLRDQYEDHHDETSNQSASSTASVSPETTPATVTEPNSRAKRPRISLLDLDVGATNAQSIRSSPDSWISSQVQPSPVSYTIPSEQSVQPCTAQQISAESSRCQPQDFMRFDGDIDMSEFDAFGEDLTISPMLLQQHQNDAMFSTSQMRAQNGDLDDEWRRWISEPPYGNSTGQVFAF